MPSLRWAPRVTPRPRSGHPHRKDEHTGDDQRHTGVIGPSGETTQGARLGRSARAAAREGQADCRVGGAVEGVARG
eukprot:673958-Alexandrium_andersonii.AAC.1